MMNADEAMGDRVRTCTGKNLPEYNIGTKKGASKSENSTDDKNLTIRTKDEGFNVCNPSTEDNKIIKLKEDMKNTDKGTDTRDTIGTEKNVAENKFDIKYGADTPEIKSNAASLTGKKNTENAMVCNTVYELDGKVNSKKHMEDTDKAKQ